MRVEHIGNATLVLADCMDVMRDMPDKAFDLAIVDPPYGIGASTMQMGPDYNSRQWERRSDWDTVAPDQRYFDELRRVSINQIIWGGNYFKLPISSAWIFWDKGVGDGMSFADGELAWSSHKMPLRKVRIDHTGFRISEKKIHPTQKPVALYKWLLSRYAKPGDTILDTHGGSGSSVIACLDMGYEIMWIEKDPDYFQAALKRIKDFAAQPKLPMDDTPEPVEQWLGFEEEL